MSGPRGMRAAALVVLAVYAAVALLHPPGVPAWTRDVVLGNLPFVAATCLLVRRAAARPEDRIWTLAAGGGHHVLPGRQHLLHGGRGTGPGRRPLGRRRRLPGHLPVPGGRPAARAAAEPARRTPDRRPGRDRRHARGRRRGHLGDRPADRPGLGRQPDRRDDPGLPGVRGGRGGAHPGRPRHGRPGAGPVVRGLGPRHAGLRDRRHHLRLPARVRQLPRRHLARRAVAGRPGPGRDGRDHAAAPGDHPRAARGALAGRLGGGRGEHGRGPGRRAALVGQPAALGAGAADADHLRAYACCSPSSSCASSPRSARWR